MAETKRRILTEVTKEELEKLLAGDYSEKTVLKNISTVQLLDELQARSIESHESITFDRILDQYKKLVKGTLKDNDINLEYNLIIVGV